MKKENLLVIVLVVLGFGGAYFLFTGPLSRDQPAVRTEEALLPPPDISVADSPSSGTGAGIDWKPYSAGLAEARRTGRHVYLYFHAPWCTYCVKLSQTTFTDFRIQEYLGENFVSIAVNSDDNPSLAGDWQVKGLPTMWFLTPDGGQISSMPGYVDAPQLLRILKYVRTQSYETMSFQEFIRNN